ncbi:uncharacterized protein LOC118456673 [Anopheles albimanus]|uniref:uncharacterized protein LOC118456673 n=1 Tax=Anopheles albimanus TaxID=7167 RepID=UPI0016422F42|nr:uncharacterized protein LOC118456673 [Anopheles albimanus]
MMEMTDKKPKKIYRHVLKGLQFYHLVDGSGCTLNELVSYVFLKNQRIYSPPKVHKWVTEVLESFEATNLIKSDPWGNVQLHDVLLQGPFDSEENFNLNPKNNRQNSSQQNSNESLSVVPHYRSVLRRKGTDVELPKTIKHARNRPGTSDSSSVIEETLDDNLSIGSQSMEDEAHNWNSNSSENIMELLNPNKEKDQSTTEVQHPSTDCGDRIEKPTSPSPADVEG